MRCNICDVIIDNPQVNFRTGKIEPCNTCLDAVKEIVYEGRNETIEGVFNTEDEIPTTEELIIGSLSELA